MAVVLVKKPEETATVYDLIVDNGKDWFGWTPRYGIEGPHTSNKIEWGLRSHNILVHKELASW
jgi:hypothetical protein